MVLPGKVSFALAAACALAVATPRDAAAQHITIDGRFSPVQTLAGPNYAIGASLGKQVGSNLFHSFGKFGLATGESAAFSGPAAISNIIGRVTGGNLSSIDGKIQSTIAGANLFLINPSGIVFGPHATVNVSGAFHASTADYLKMTDGARFPGDQPRRQQAERRAAGGVRFSDGEAGGDHRQRQHPRRKLGANARTGRRASHNYRRHDQGARRHHPRGRRRRDRRGAGRSARHGRFDCNELWPGQHHRRFEARRQQSERLGRRRQCVHPCGRIDGQFQRDQRRQLQLGGGWSACFARQRPGRAEQRRLGARDAPRAPAVAPM